MQHTATDCNTLQLTATHCSTRRPRRNATHCNTLQHTATHCNRLQLTATHCSTRRPRRTATHCNTLQHTASHCNLLQHTVAQDARDVTASSLYQKETDVHEKRPTTEMFKKDLCTQRETNKKDLQKRLTDRSAVYMCVYISLSLSPYIHI